MATVIIEEEEERSEGRRKIDNSVSYVMNHLSFRGQLMLY